MDELKRFAICQRKIGDIPVYIHRSGFTGENGYEIYAAFDKSQAIHDAALQAVEQAGGRELQTLEVYVRSVPMEKGFALKQDFKHLSPYECAMGWAVAENKDFIGKAAALERKAHPKYRMVGTGIFKRIHRGYFHLGAGLLVRCGGGPLRPDHLRLHCGQEHRLRHPPGRCAGWGRGNGGMQRFSACGCK